MAGGGVYPVYGLTFKISTTGRAGEPSAVIADLETFSVSVDGNVVEWTPMDTEGWTRRIMTGKSITVSTAGKRNEGDPGNDYVAGLAYKNGADCDSKLEIGFPSGAKLAFGCVVNTTVAFGGGSTDVSALEAEFLSDGKPTFTPAPAGG